MRLYQLYSKQLLPISKQEAWDFISNPKNLNVITPKHMGFNIISGDDRPMFSGQIIQYVVKPFPLLRTKWVTEITHVSVGKYFVDEQRFGPYSFWHHKHFLKETKDGIEMEDIIDYKIPFGILGKLAHQIFVRKKLQCIFEYRKEKLTELFGKVDGVSSTLKLNSI
ncbi:MAG: SRPBCC family protein [Flavobacteriaceae bacterium]